MTTYAILHKGDPERCIRFIRQYCKDWHTTNEGAVRNFFIRLSPFAIASHPYCKVDSDFDNPRISDVVTDCDTFIDFENNPRRRAL
jgi:hypothetical protein